MATFVPAKKNTAYTTYVSLPDATDPRRMRANPTLASGDVKVAIDDGAPANLGTLPVVDADFTKRVKVVLTSGEMNGDNITLIFADQTDPPEWGDLTINIPTAARQIDDLAYPATSGRSMVVDANGLVDANTVKLGPTGSGTAQTARDIGASVLLSSGTGTGQLSITSGVAAANVTQFGGSNGTFASGRPEVNTTHAAGTAWGSGAITAGAIASGALTAIAAAVWDRLTSALTTVGSIGKLLVDNVNATISSRSTLAAGAAMTLTSGERTAIANEVEVQIIDETDSEKVLQAIVDKIASVNPDLGDLSIGAIASASADAVWDATREAMLKSLTIVNSNGIALNIESNTDHAVLVTATGTHEGAKFVGGSGAAGLYAQGGTDGPGFKARGNGTGKDIDAGEIDDMKNVTDQLTQMLEDDGGTSRFTTNALEQGPTGGTPTEIADEVATRTIEANIVQVNGVAVDGAGTEGDPFGPA